MVLWSNSGNFNLHRHKNSKEEENEIVEIHDESEVSALNFEEEFKKLLICHIVQMKKAYQSDTLKNIGTIVVVENKNEWYSETGNILQNGKMALKAVEFAETIYLESMTVFHGCFCVSNDFAVDAFCEDKNMDADVLSEWKKNMI